MDLNKIMLIGRIWSDLDLLDAKSWNKYMRISVATNRWGKDEPTDWHNVSLFGKTAEAIYEYWMKWSKIYIEWSLNVDKVEKEEGNRTYYNVAAMKAILLDNKSGKDSNEPLEVEEPF